MPAPWSAQTRPRRTRPVSWVRVQVVGPRGEPRDLECREFVLEVPSRDLLPTRPGGAVEEGRVGPEEALPAERLTRPLRLDADAPLAGLGKNVVAALPVKRVAPEEPSLHRAGDAAFHGLLRHVVPEEGAVEHPRGREAKEGGEPQDRVDAPEGMTVTTVRREARVSRSGRGTTAPDPPGRHPPIRQRGGASPPRGRRSGRPGS